MHDDEIEPLLPESFIVSVVDEEGGSVAFNLRPRTKISAIYDAYRKEKNVVNIVLYLGKKVLKYSDSFVSSTKLKEGDIIHVIYDENEW